MDLQNFFDYELFLQKDVKPEEREDVGLQAVFKKVFPITDFSGVAELKFVKYDDLDSEGLGEYKKLFDKK